MDQTSDFANLSKKERKRLKREMERQEYVKEQKKGSMVKWFFIGAIVVLVVVGGWLLVKNLSKPLPGQQMPDQGRNHVGQDQWSKFSYNSNPPTSGPHDPEWTKAGVYDSPTGDGHLVHSLEHGYIVISYNCGSDSNEKTATTEAQNKNETQKEGLSVSATFSGSVVARETSVSPLSNEDCDNLKKQLTDLANDKKIWKLIVIPRPNLDTRIAVTAWTWVEKFNEFDKGKIVAFIDAHRNHGPEQTME